ncbi:MAG TPA: POTRA domain-containing protein [Cellvibrio sp.]
MVRNVLWVSMLPVVSCPLVYGADPAPDQMPHKPPAIEEITIVVHPVFDESNPKENNFLFRLVNKLHIDTKKHVIEKDLTFKKGEVLDKHLLEESERRLRERRYFADAKVVAGTTQDAGQPVQVDVHEVWTLIPKITYSNTGGNTHYGYGLHDSNFLGLGKTVKVEQSSSVDRTSNIVVYRDPNFGNDKQLALEYADNSDGKEQQFHFSSPFRSIRTPWAAGIDMLDFEREDTLYNAGEETWRFGHEGTDYSVFYGQRFNSSTDDRTARWMLGWDSIKHDFFEVPTTTNSYSGELPADRDYNIAWFEYSYLHNQFIKTLNIQQINRTEDFNLGSQWRARIGKVIANSEPLDGATLLELQYGKAFQFSPSQLLTSEILTSGFYSSKQSTQAVSKIDISYHWQNFSRGQFYVMLNETYGRNLFADTPLELGGDTGLRGYPARFMAGDRSRLLTVEQRYFGETEWFSLFHLGAAIFYDEGKAWGNTSVPQTYQSTMRDVGIGLRISGTRTGGRNDGAHNVGHIDLAFPLDGGPEIDKYQISVRIKTGF